MNCGKKARHSVLYKCFRRSPFVLISPLKSADSLWSAFLVRFFALRTVYMYGIKWYNSPSILG